MNMRLRVFELRVEALVVACVAWCMVQVSSFAEVPPQQSLTFAWDAPTNTPGPFTYKMYKVQDGVTNLLWSTTNTTGVVSNLTPTAFRVFVTASNERGESDPSIPVVQPAFPQPPTKLKPISTTFRVTPPVAFEKTSDLIAWDERFRLFKPDSNGVQVVMQTIRPEDGFAFYRVRPEPRPGLPR